MDVISGAARDLSMDLLSKIAAYRYRVFVDTLQWDLPSEDGIELDQFDDPATVYVATHDEFGDLTGVARLLPTNRPYLLREIFPQLLNGLTPPCSPEIWELSRFAAIDFNKGPTSQGGLSSPTAVRLLRAAIACAAARGAERLITVSPLGIERLLRRAGFRSHRAGPPVIIDGHPLCACWIELTDAVAGTDNVSGPAVTRHAMAQHQHEA
jgi:acyl homoserine lactone synthase